MSNSKEFIPDGGNPILAMLASECRAASVGKRGHRDLYPLIPLAVLLAIGSFIVGAVSAVDTAVQQRTINNKLDSIRNGLDAVQQQIAGLSAKMDRVLAEISGLIPEIRAVLDEALYRNTIQTYLSLADNAQQNIATYNVSPVVAWQRIDQIKAALNQLQESAKVIFDAGPMKLDTALLVAPLVATWITEWDMNETVWKENDPTHVVINARDHLFFRETVIPHFEAMFDRCEKSYARAVADLKNIVCPGDPDDLQTVFEFNPVGQGRFKKVAPYPSRSGLFRYDTFQISVPLQITQARGGPRPSVSWEPAVRRTSDGTAIPNPELDDPQTAFKAWEARMKIWEYRRLCDTTIASLSDHAAERQKVIGALRRL